MIYLLALGKLKDPQALPTIEQGLEDPENGVRCMAAEALRGLGIATQTGRFGAKMQVELANEGPVTIVLDSETFERPRRG